MHLRPQVILSGKERRIAFSAATQLPDSSEVLNIGNVAKKNHNFFLYEKNTSPVFLPTDNLATSNSKVLKSCWVLTNLIKRNLIKSGTGLSSFLYHKDFFQIFKVSF